MIYDSSSALTVLCDGIVNWICKSNNPPQIWSVSHHNNRGQARTMMIMIIIVMVMMMMIMIEMVMVMMIEMMMMMLK